MNGLDRRSVLPWLVLGLAAVLYAAGRVPRERLYTRWLTLTGSR